MALAEANRRGLYRAAHGLASAQRAVRRHVLVRDQAGPRGGERSDEQAT